MRSFLPIGVALGSAMLAVAALAAGTVQVSFVKPENFADVRGAHLRADDNLRALQRDIEALAAQYVGDGQTLKVEVLDVDLAGEIHHGRRLNDVRVLRGRADWPRITLRYVLEAPGVAPRTGQAVVADMAYLERTRPYDHSETMFPYERRMLDEWFRAEFQKR